MQGFYMRFFSIIIDSSNVMGLDFKCLSTIVLGLLCCSVLCSLHLSYKRLFLIYSLYCSEQFRTNSIIILFVDKDREPIGLYVCV